MWRAFFAFKPGTSRMTFMSDAEGVLCFVKPAVASVLCERSRAYLCPGTSRMTYMSDAKGVLCFVKPAVASVLCEREGVFCPQSRTFYVSEGRTLPAVASVLCERSRGKKTTIAAISFAGQAKVTKDTKGHKGYKYNFLLLRRIPGL